MNGPDLGYIYVNGTRIRNIEPNPAPVGGAIYQPSYYFRYSTGGSCGFISTACAPLFRLMGYKVIELGSTDHAWLEVYRDGTIYVASNGVVYPRDYYYAHQNQTVYPPGSYDPDWYLK